MDDAPPDPFADPVLGPLLERALARYGPHVTESQLAELRGTLELLVAAHPELAALAEQASAELRRQASQAPKESGVVAKRGKRAARGTGTGGGGDR